MSSPNFMLLGASKSATTTLYDILKEHDDVYTPSFKEPHFFNIDENYDKGLVWYQETYYKNTEKKKVIFDFTPTYLYSSSCAKRIFDNLGAEVKFIVILRNPVDRAYSQYLHSRRDGHESSEFISSIHNEFARIDAARRNNDILSEFRYSYISQGLYYNMLRSYLKYFKLENFLIINFEEEIVDNIEKTIKKLSDFLNIDLSTCNFDIHSNRSGKSRFSFIQEILKKSGFWRDLIKFFTPQLLRQIIRNKIKNFNKVDFSYNMLEKDLRKKIYKEYFARDVLMLEELINKKMNWDIK
jgi:hypothetical protein